MAMQLMPYGSPYYLRISAKVSDKSKAPQGLAPYGSPDHRNLATKVGIDDPKIKRSRDETRRVVRLNKARD